MRSSHRSAARLAALLAMAALAGCPAAPPLSVPPTEEIYPPGPQVQERPLPEQPAGAGGDPSSVLVGGDGGPQRAVDRLPDGESCFESAECESGACEGEGCGMNQPGRCMPATRACSAAEEEFCGCDGQTFRAPADCPGQPYASRGACAGPGRP